MNSDINEELASLYKEKAELEKRLSKINSKIGKIQGYTDEEIIVKTMSAVIEDDKKFVNWFIKRQETIEKRKRKNNLKNKIKQGIKLTQQDALPNSNFIYALYDKKNIVYIGLTKNLDQRIKDHRKSEKIFDRYEILNIFNDRFYALREENNLIKVHKPKYNKQVF